MPQFLFAVEIPPFSSGSIGLTASPEWSQFAHKADTTIKTVKAVVQLQPNVWLLPAENNLPLLMELASFAAKGSLSYSALLIPDGVVTLALDVKPLP